MFKLSTAALVVAFSAGAAMAADLPSLKGPPLYAPPPLLTWNGFYVGLNAGYAFSGNNSVNTLAAPLFAAPTWSTELALSTALATGRNNANNDAFIGGGQIGYNYQYGAFVLGLEADIQGLATGKTSSLRVGAGVPVGFPAETILSVATASRSVDYLGTVRGRLGYLITPALLLYGTGGLAYGGVTANSSILQQNLPFTPAFASAGSFSDTRVGWTAGGGGEWMFSPNWSAKAEYLYYDLGTVSYGHSALAFNPGPLLYASAPASRVRFDGHVVRAGLNYHFNWAPPAPVLAKY